MAFKKGQSGNPSGRTKGSLTRPRLKDNITKKEIRDLVSTAKEKANHGDVKLLIFILEQIYGKAPQSVEVSGKDGAPMLIKLNE
tara:strand:+ start:126 stop:377 length:252 start_codon:yes stop_codon:yes gene_type:complete